MDGSSIVITTGEMLVRILVYVVVTRTFKAGINSRPGTHVELRRADHRFPDRATVIQIMSKEQHLLHVLQ